MNTNTHPYAFSFLAFEAEHLHYNRQPNYSVGRTELYSAYLEYCSNTGSNPVSMPTFHCYVLSRQVEASRQRNPNGRIQHCYCGVRLV